ncbi:nuclear transport factor 2 family protein [Actinomadura rudentiformis]|uniref:hypothetical protein n=1 Tax=Actinomadura rudentiformis TaxID=359158 RepID=UPI00178C8024|nr:hypothetical protein [Actinomadura rudentiformis]
MALATTQLETFVDRVRITELIDRYMLSLDEAVIDEEWAAAFHTEDVSVSTPLDKSTGLVGFAEATREELGGHFDVGGIFQGEVVRSGEGWRFRRLDVRPVWFSGRPPIFEGSAS